MLLYPAHLGSARPQIFTRLVQSPLSLPLLPGPRYVSCTRINPIPSCRSQNQTAGEKIISGPQYALRRLQSTPSVDPRGAKEDSCLIIVIIVTLTLIPIIIIIIIIIKIILTLT